jgi:hypothetical protein
VVEAAVQIFVTQKQAEQAEQVEVELALEQMV